jgi:hypothetical protein
VRYSRNEKKLTILPLALKKLLKNLRNSRKSSIFAGESEKTIPNVKTRLRPKEIVCLGLAFVLLLSLLPLSYGLFVLVRLVTTAVFGYLVYDFYTQKAIVPCIVSVLIMVLYQPFANVTIEPEIWHVVDMIVALLLFGYVVWERLRAISAALASPITPVELAKTHGYDVFVSYSTKDYYDRWGNPLPDSVIADVLTALEDAGISYWIDKQGLAGGTVFPQEIARQIYNCKVFLYISSENANQSTWTMNEIATANSYGKTIIPLRADASDFAPAIMIYIAGLQYVNYYLNPDAAKRQLVETVSRS